MATTNKDIIAAYKVANNIPLTAPLYTYAAWIAHGYRVRKGEKCRHRVTLWKYASSKNDQGGETGRCFHKVANLFEMSQVERMV